MLTIHQCIKHFEKRLLVISHVKCSVYKENDSCNSSCHLENKQYIYWSDLTKWTSNLELTVLTQSITFSYHYLMCLMELLIS